MVIDKELEILIERYVSDILKLDKTDQLKEGNRLMNRIIKTYCKIREYGDAGWESLENLLEHSNQRVRFMVTFDLYQKDPQLTIQRLKELAETAPQNSYFQEGAKTGYRLMSQGKYEDPFDRYKK